ENDNGITCNLESSAGPGGAARTGGDRKRARDRTRLPPGARASRRARGVLARSRRRADRRRASAGAPAVDAARPAERSRLRPALRPCDASARLAVSRVADSGNDASSAPLADSSGLRPGPAVTFATTEHFNLQTARAVTVSEANGRASI